MIGRPYKSFERINRIFGQCLAKLDDQTLSEKEKQERAQFIQNCQRVCDHLAAKRTVQEGESHE